MSIYDKSSLVLIPSGTKTGKVFSQKPVSGDGDFTFTRSSAATRVNADGNIEKETQNLLKQSNTFNVTANWANGGGDYTITSGQSGYDGSSDAWLISKASTGNHYISQGNVSASGVNTTSVYAKAGTADGLMLYTAVGYARWNLSTGLKINEGGSPIDTNIESIGSGWYRCSVTTNGSIPSVLIKPVNSTGAGVAGGIYIQDAQLEQGLVARDYIETTTAAVYGGITDNTPRLDYTDSSCPALLLEPQRTNIFAQSEYYNTYWNHTNSSVSNNQLESPEGFINASVLSATSPAQSGINVFNTWSDSTTYTMSAFVKKKIGSYIGFGVYGNAMGDEWIKWNLDNGTSTATNLWTNADFEDFGNGWYRISATITTTSGSTSKSGFKLNLMTNTSYSSGNVGDEAYIYGLQLEVGSYATSYIPTYGSSVSRIKDNMDTTFSSPIPTTGNVSYFIHLDGSDSSGNATGSHAAIRFQGNDYITYNATGGGNHRIRVNVNGNSNYYSASVAKSQEAKVLAVINGDYIKIFVNGQQQNQGTLSDMPDMLSATSYTGNTNDNLGPLPINQIMLFPTALTDQEAIDLTTI